MIPSPATLPILLLFVLPGYFARKVVGRSFPLPRISDLDLVIQCVLISCSFILLTALVWLLASACIPQLTGPQALAAGFEPSRSALSQPAWLRSVLLFSVGLFALSYALSSIRPLTRRLLGYGSGIQQYSLYDKLFYELPTRLAAPASEPVSVWISTIVDSGREFTGELYAYRSDDDSSGDLVIAHAAVRSSDGDSWRLLAAEELVYVARTDVRAIQVAYTTRAGTRLAVR